MSIRRAIVETMFAMDNAKKALYHGEQLLDAQGMFLLDDDTERHLERLETYVNGLDWESEDVMFTVLGMNFLPPFFTIGYIEVVDPSQFDVFIPLLGRGPESFKLTSDGELHDLEKSMSETLMRGLRVAGDNDWLNEFYTEVGLRHPVYLEVVKRITAILDIMATNSATYELRGRGEVFEYFFIAVVPRLEKILKYFLNNS